MEFHEIMSIFKFSLLALILLIELLASNMPICILVCIQCVHKVWHQLDEILIVDS